MSIQSQIAGCTNGKNEGRGVRTKVRGREGLGVGRVYRVGIGLGGSVFVARASRLPKLKMGVANTGRNSGRCLRIAQHWHAPGSLGHSDATKCTVVFDVETERAICWILIRY